MRGSEKRLMAEVRRNRRATVKWKLFIYYFAIVCTLVSGILFVPLYGAHIPIEIYGALLASGNILFWVSAFDMGLVAFLVSSIVILLTGLLVSVVTGFKGTDRVQAAL